MKLKRALAAAAGSLAALGALASGATAAPGTPATASTALYPAGLFHVSHQAVTVPGRSVVVSGVVRPYVPGQRILLQAFDGHRLFANVKLNLKASKRGVYGGFHWSLRAPAAGAVQVIVRHSLTPELSAFRTELKYTALSPAVSPGARGSLVTLVQERLAALHLYIPQTGVWDAGTQLALNAYNRLLGHGEGHIELDPGTLNDLLDGVGAFHVRFPGQGRHAEGDLSDQVLALINGSQVQELFPISSGKPSTPTVLGSWQIYRRTPGLLPDGMYFSDFFIRGYAIHGYNPAPDYPASHGCMRLPMVDAIPAFDWLALGDWVDTYYT